jgi:DNA-binding response OmpR family regulator
MPARRILLVDDDGDIRQLVDKHLRDAGYDVRQAADGRAALSYALSEPFQLIVLDLILPGVGGLEVCRALRVRGVQTPILMLTAKASEADRVTGLDEGADDYMGKPFTIRELLAHVRAIFRRIETVRAQSATDTATIRAGGVTLDLDKRTVHIEDRSVELTAKEFDLLALLARHPGRVYSRAQLLDLIWGYRHDGSGHTVNSHINRLRGKIEVGLRNPRYVQTVRGVGYRFSDAGPEHPGRG